MKKSKPELKLVTGDRIECAPYVAEQLAGLMRRIALLSNPQAVAAEIEALKVQGSHIIQTVVDTLGKTPGNWTAEIKDGKVYLVHVVSSPTPVVPATEPAKE